MIKEAIILTTGKIHKAEGKKEVPVSLIEVGNKRFIERQLDYLDFWGINYVGIGINSDQTEIAHYLGDRYKSINLEYFEDIKTNGTGGVLKKCMEGINGHQVFILNGDLFFDVSLKRFDDYRRSKEAVVSIAMRFVDSTTRLGSLMFNEDARITGFSKNQDPFGDDFMNAGVYCMSTSYFLRKETPESFSFENEFLQQHVETDPYFGFRCYSAFLDMATNIDCKRAEHEFRTLPYR